MKKVFLFAVAAAALVACSNEELSTPDNALVSKEAPVNFSVYTQRGLTRAGVPGDLDNDNIGAAGFGVFAYYTAGEQYDAKATPNFMYNQKVTCTGTATAGTLWTYEPVKYWPNEYGNDATSDEIDYLTFFAYAPWTNIEPTTGNIVPDATNQAESVEHQQKYNIISVNKNTATGDPIVKYVVDTDPATSVDLLWGVAAADAANQYSPITGTNPVAEGLPFINLVKPNDPASHRMQFNLKHALAKVKVTIDYVADANTPTPAQGQTAATIDANTTRIYVRNFKMSGFATKGALNLNNTAAGEPLWKDFDGVKDLTFDEVVYQDGRKDGKEGETNGAQSNETPQGLNPNIIENYALLENGQFTADKTTGVTKDPQNLFGGDQTANDGYFYVIPRNEDSPVDLQIAYDVETIDPALAGKLSDGETHGISIENVIQKANIFGQNVDFKAGYVYEIKIHLGMTSVKVEATVTEWKDETTNHIDADLPANQQGNGTGGSGTGGNTPAPQPSALNTAVTNALANIAGVTVSNGADDTHVTVTGVQKNADAIQAVLAAIRGTGQNQQNTVSYNSTNYTWGGNTNPGYRVNAGGFGGGYNYLRDVIAGGGNSAAITVPGGNLQGTITLEFE